jgi:hypothetical protein
VVQRSITIQSAHLSDYDNFTGSDYFVAVFAFVSVVLITMVNLVSRVLGLSAFVGFIIGLLVYVLLGCPGWAVDRFARRLEVSNDHIGTSG